MPKKSNTPTVVFQLRMTQDMRAWLGREADKKYLTASHLVRGYIREEMAKPDTTAAPKGSNA